MRGRGITFIFLVSLFFASFAFADITKSYLVGEGFSEEEIECLENALQISPDNFGTYYGLGVAYYRKGDYDKVIECYHKIAQLQKPNYEEAALNLEMAYSRIRGFHKTAPNLTFIRQREIESLAKAIEINPQVAQVYVYLAGLPSINTKDLNEEIGYLERALEINPHNFGTLYSLGVAYYRKGDYDKALECLQRFTQLNPACSLTYYGLGVAFYKLGERDKALEQVIPLRSAGRDDLADELEEAIGVDFFHSKGQELEQLIDELRSKGLDDFADELEQTNNK